MALTPTAVWNVSPELVLALDEHLGAPVDSYVNGTQTWLTDSHPGGVTLEWRLHPVPRYEQPAGCSIYDVWDAVVSGIVSGTGTEHLPIGTELRALSSIWEGLECFPAYGDEVEPPILAGTARDALGIAPDASGLVDHERIGDAWEREPGAVSIMGLLLDDLQAD
ncbi:MAG: hypothetical protein WEA75_09005 [Acidimicrobiia bacterium]